MRRRRIGRPGLVGTMARTAVVAGTASATVGAMQNRQAKRAEAAATEHQTQQAALESQAQLAEMQAQITQMQAEQTAPAPSPLDAVEEDDLIAQLQRLADLKSAGVLDDAEFASAKAKLLA